MMQPRFYMKPSPQEFCLLTSHQGDTNPVGVLPAGSPSYTPMRVVCRQGLVEIKTQWCEEHKDLDRFRPPECNTLRPVWWSIFPLVLFEVLVGSLLALI